MGSFCAEALRAWANSLRSALGFCLLHSWAWQLGRTDAFFLLLDGGILRISGVQACVAMFHRRSSMLTSHKWLQLVGAE